MAFRRLQIAAALAAGLLACLASAADDDGNSTISYPAANMTFHLLDTVDVSYSTEYETPWMYLFCRDDSGNRQEILYYSPSDVVNKTNIAIKLQSNTTYTGSTCWFNLRGTKSESGTDTAGVTSPEFGYVKQVDAQNTYAASTTGISIPVATNTAVTTTSASGATVITVGAGTSTATTTGGAASATSGADSASSAESADTTTDSQLPMGARVGIGIGTAVVGIGMVVAAVFICVRRRKRAEEASLGGTSTTAVSSRGALSPPVELPMGPTHYELGSDDKFEKEGSPVISPTTPIKTAPPPPVVNHIPGVYELPAGKEGDAV